MMKNFGPKKFDNFSMLMVALGYASRKVGDLSHVGVTQNIRSI